MHINGIQTYNCGGRQPDFKGSIKSTHLFNDCALDYARGIKVCDEDWTKLKMFINTIRAVKGDGTSNELVLDTVGSAQKRLWSIKYGDYCNQDEFFNTDIYAKKSYGPEKLREDAFKKIVEFGKKHFGIAVLSNPIPEFAPANRFIKRANEFAAKSKIAKDRDSAVKLSQKSKLAEQKAEESIKDIRKTVLNNL